MDIDGDKSNKGNNNYIKASLRLENGKRVVTKIANTDDKKNDDDKPLSRLLVVDDDSNIAHVLKLGLQENGFLVNQPINQLVL